MRWQRRATWLPIVPERTRRADSCKVRLATEDSREVVVGSSRKTSSKRVAFSMAVSIEAVGVVTVSLRKS